MLLTELGLSQEQFVRACAVGMKDPENNKFFEQLVTCENFNYFKGMMVRRNIQLQEEAYRILFNELEAKHFGFGAKEQAAIAEKLGFSSEIDINEILKRVLINRIRNGTSKTKVEG